jgi:predicted acetyltransferase
MPELVRPTTKVHASFLVAMEEFYAEGRGGSRDNTMIGRESRTYGWSWQHPRAFARYVDSLHAAAVEEPAPESGLVPSTTLWYVDGVTYLGRLSIRHRLTAFLLEEGGHIGYDVRPTARRRGHATAMLRAALPVANQLRIDPVLVTCDTDNEGSRKVIEAAGGLLEDERRGKLRYWVPTS